MFPECKKVGELSKLEWINVQKRDLQEGLGLDGRIILEYIFEKQVLIQVIGLIRLNLGIIGEPF